MKLFLWMNPSRFRYESHEILIGSRVFEARKHASQSRIDDDCICQQWTGTQMKRTRRSPNFHIDENWHQKTLLVRLSWGEGLN